MKKITLFIALIICCLQLKSQDYKADLTQALSIFQEEKYEVEMEYLLFPSHTAAQSIERETVGMKKDGARFRMHQFGTHIIHDDEHILMINEKSKFIVIDKKRTQPSPTEDDKKAMTALDAALADLSKSMGLDTMNISPEDAYDIEHNGAEKGQKVYTINYQYGEYEKITTYINTQNNRMSKYIMYYRQPMEIEPGKFSKVRVEINFLRQSTQPDFTNKPFDIQKYISIKTGGKVEVSNPYSDYNIINHLEERELVD